ncbi:unnamed protein product, partial [Mesorhabditis spiculigera]
MEQQPKTQPTQPMAIPQTSEKPTEKPTSTCSLLADPETRKRIEEVFLSHAQLTPPDEFGVRYVYVGAHD